MPFVINATLADSHGRVFKKVIETTADTLANAQAAGTQWASTLNAISDIGLVRITYSFVDDSDAFAYAAGANGDEGGTFRVLLDDGKYAPHKVPSPAADLRVAGSDALLIDDPDVVNYFALFELAGPLRLSDGQYITDLVKGTLDR